ncbi:MAG: 5-dehydro-2-deoxygluconokinase [Acidimicrobiaceae bacterium]|nr:5-dehydro-2-deoxygluconokinase [Acidimicrobiaceae bacterium]
MSLNKQCRVAADPAHSLELLTVGRVSVDIYAQQLGVSMTEATTFRKSIGGTSTNVAVAAARLGHRCATVTRVGDDEFGAYVRHALEHTFGVDTRFVRIDPELKTPLAFAELNPPEDPNIIFYREPRAPDQNLALDDVDLDVVREVPVLWVPASRFAWEPSRSTVAAMLDERRRRPHTVLDLDWRPMFWDSPAAASERIAPMLDRFSIAIGNREECEIAVGAREPDEAADRLLERGLSAAVVKLGADGVMVALDDGTRETIAPFPVEVICGLGSGDAFGGAFCHGLLNGWDLISTVEYGNAAGAIVANRLMCADDMPTMAEIDDFLASGLSTERRQAV